MSIVSAKHSQLSSSQEVQGCREFSLGRKSTLIFDSTYCPRISSIPLPASHLLPFCLDTGLNLSQFYMDSGAPPLHCCTSLLQCGSSVWILSRCGSVLFQTSDGIGRMIEFNPEISFAVLRWLSADTRPAQFEENWWCDLLRFYTPQPTCKLT